MPRTSASVSSPVRTAPVLAVLVCHNGQPWLPDVLAALPEGTVRPRHVLAVDTGSTDDTPELLARAAEDGVVDGVLTLPIDTGYAAAVTAAVEAGLDRWGDPGSWLWLLHDDSAPDPDCLDLLLRAADTASSAAMLGPLAVDWSDPRLVVESGLSTDASGHRRQVDTRALGDGTPEQTTEVLAVPSAGALVSRAAWDDLGGFDTGIPLLREDLDFGWRANASGRVVLCVPRARVRHARAVTTRQRSAHAGGGPAAGLERVHGTRTVLVNRAGSGFLLGLVALPALCLVRMLVFALLRDGERARAEWAAVRAIAGGVRDLRRARARRPHRGSLPGLYTGTVGRCRAGLRRLVVRLVRGNTDDGTDTPARGDPADLTDPTDAAGPG
ncbi:glycosyltransferase family 2 protein, partial [Saccharomonospora iraqiensis]|uniref:glycosyltransferase family 2 protein n=1 Tax=Saccharomonospora iraqiensis TaxID=52698 RepID=UPI00022E89C9